MEDENDVHHSADVFLITGIANALRNSIAYVFDSVSLQIRYQYNTLSRWTGGCIHVCSLRDYKRTRV